MLHVPNYEIDVYEDSKAVTFENIPFAVAPGFKEVVFTRSIPGSWRERVLQKTDDPLIPDYFTAFPATYYLVNRWTAIRAATGVLLGETHATLYFEEGALAMDAAKSALAKVVKEYRPAEKGLARTLGGMFTTVSFTTKER